MSTLYKRAIFVVLVTFSATPILYAGSDSSVNVAPINSGSFCEWVNTRQPSVNKEDKQKIREDWEKCLGIDVFYPYFKLKNMQNTISTKSSVTIFKRFRGRLEIKEDEAKYIFRFKF